MSEIGKSLAQWWSNIQGTLFPLLGEELDPLTEKQQQLVTILEVIREGSGRDESNHFPKFRHPVRTQACVCYVGCLKVYLLRS